MKETYQIFVYVSCQYSLGLNLNLSRTPVLRIAKEVLPIFLQLYLKESKEYARNKNILCINSLCVNMRIINAECKLGTW